MHVIIAYTVWVLLAAGLLFPLLGFPEEKKPAAPSCPEQLTLTQALARENDRHRDNAVREKVSYQLAYESEHKRRIALEKELVELKAKLPPESATDKKPE